MVILGAKGHAKEVLDVFEKNDFQKPLFFFDDISTDLPDKIYNKYLVIKDLEKLSEHFQANPTFVLGTGSPTVRKKLYSKALNIGGKIQSIISSQTQIGLHNVLLGKGLNIMHGVFISNDVSIGEGCLINTNSTIHHDVSIGDFCEIAPNVSITGNVKIGNNCFIGTNATILPNVVIGNNVIVGAGAVVVKNIINNQKVFGVPAKNHKS